MITQLQLRSWIQVVVALAVCWAVPAAAQGPSAPADAPPPPARAALAADAATAPPPASAATSAAAAAPAPAATPTSADQASASAPGKPATEPPGKSDLATSQAMPPPVSGLPSVLGLPGLPGLTDQKPAAIDIGGLPIAELLGNDTGFSGLGSFRALLPKYGISAYLHGMAIARFNEETSPEDPLLNVDGFNNNPNFGAEFNMFVGAEIANRLFAEMQLFYSSEANHIAVDYAQLDLRIFRDLLFIRGGRFRVPLGNVNSYPDPRYTFKMPILPLFFYQVVPGEWEELGAELYGRYSWGEGRALSYAVYVVNGLEQRVVNPGDPISGGPIAKMTDNYLDANDPDKAVGAQIQVEPVPGLSFGISGYEGVYTIVDKKRIYILDTHLGWMRGKLTLRGEFAATFQETETDTLLKYGGYVLAAYRVIKYLEPVVMFDGFRLDGSPDLDRFAATVGLNFYPFPQKAPSASTRMAYSALFNDSGAFVNNRVAVQLQVAF
jgi:hypothetical protein